jgi:hypothetical protein
VTTAATSAASDARPKRLTSGPFDAARSYPSSSPIPSVIGVFVRPGATAFTLMSYRPDSPATVRVTADRPAFEAA